MTHKKIFPKRNLSTVLVQPYVTQKELNDALDTELVLQTEFTGGGGGGGDVVAHNASLTAHSTLFSGKENTGVAAGLVTAHDGNLSAHSSLLSGKENTGVAAGLVSGHDGNMSAHSSLLSGKENTGVAAGLVSGHETTYDHKTATKLANQFVMDNTIDWTDKGIVFANGTAYYPSLIYDANGFDTFGDPVFKCFYSLGTSLKVTTSYDGVTWSAPVALTGLTTAHHPLVIYSRSGFGTQQSIKYKIWYWNSTVSNLLISTMRYAESSDGITWVNDQPITQDSTYKLITGNSGDWNAATWGFIKVFYQTNVTNTGTDPFNYNYVAYYDANTGSTYQTTGLAYSIDGKNWFNRQITPVLNRDVGNPGAWDFYTASFGSIERDLYGFHYWYTGGQTAGGFTDNFGIGYAHSTDGITWTKDAANPIFSVADGVTYRDQRCYTPSVVSDGCGTMYMLYTAVGSAASGVKKLGLATLKYAAQYGFSPVKTFGVGSCTLTAGTSTTVNMTGILSNAKVFLQPTSATAAALTGVYVSGITAGASFTITHSIATGSETFNYLIF